MSSHVVLVKGRAVLRGAFCIAAVVMLSVTVVSADPGFTAYTDVVYDSGLHGAATDPNGQSVHYIAPNVTTCGIGTETVGPTVNGYNGITSVELLDFGTGTPTGVTASLTASGSVSWNPMVPEPWDGGYDCAEGTDARNTFGGIADMTGIVWYGQVGWWVDVTFTGLNPQRRYTFVTTSSRAKKNTDGGLGYPDRYTIYTISSVDAAANASTPGTEEYLGDPLSVTFCTGNNHDEGYVARWTDIEPGVDGTLKVRAEANPSAPEGRKAYAFDVFMLQEYAECTSNGDCDDGLFCNGTETCGTNGICQPGTPVDCDDSVGCTVDSCDEVNDVCVNAASNGLCDNGEFCDGVETCDPLLDCQAGVPVDCDDSVGCTVDSCDEVNDVCVNAASNGLCDNGQFCDGVETCDPLLDCQAGVPVDCDDSVGCTVDSCDEVNDVCVNTASNGLCDNGEFCDGVETCDPLLDCQAGVPVDCDDSVGCTVDSCDEVNDVCVNAASNGLCDNGEFCDGVETCDPLLDCQAGVPVDCDDSVGCTVDSCDEVNNVCVNAASNGLCDNGEFCDGVETCDPLLDCQAGVAVDCDDSVGCTVDSCDEVNDVCVNAASNGLCDNGQFCDGVETCDPLLDCQAGVPIDCDDSVGCTVDSCDEVNDQCVNAPSNGLCDNGQFCDGVETCDPLLDCQVGVPIDCDDSVGCTVDSCDEVNDQCVNAPSNGLCDNGQFCDGIETCNPLLDCQAGTPVDCDDGVGCTVDSCDEVNDTCVNAASNGLCDNGEFCDGVETCDPLLDCQAGTPVDCADAVGCTVDSCDEVNDVCVNAASNGLCDNGEFCDGVETCDPLLDCQAGTPVDCADGVGCTVDSCDEVNDTCVNAASNGLCDNGQFCDGVETCDPLLDCRAGTPVDCDDSIGCTVDSCDEVNDVCVNAASNGLCDNGEFCDGVETCDPLLDCQAGTPVDCADGVGCTVDSCEEVNDECVNAPSNGLCDNGEFCDGVETCDPLLDCQAGTPVDCSDSVACTVDSCDEINDSRANAASNGLCDDSNVCTIDTCDPINGCVSDGTGVTIPCDDGDPCTQDDVCQGDAAGTCEGTLVLLRIENLEVFDAGRFADEPDPSRSFLGTGSTATNDNITNYVGGITGIRVFFDDVVQFSTAPADAFTFEWTTGTGTTFSSNGMVAENIDVTDTVEAGRSVVTIISSNGYVEQRWLKVTFDSAQVSTNGCELDGDLSGNPVVLPGGDGTPGGDAVFYLGNLPGEVNGDRKTTLTDVGLVRLEVQPFLPVPITNIYDVDKDGKVLLTDFGLTRLAVNPFFTLPLTAP